MKVQHKLGLFRLEKVVLEEIVVWEIQHYE